MGREKLCVVYSRLYARSRLIFTTVKFFCDSWRNQSTGSHMLWTRHLRVRELEEAVDLNTIIDNLCLQIRNDWVSWVCSGNKYKSADGRKFLCKEMILSRGNWKSIWKLRIPTKVQLFMWKVEHGVLHTKVLLSKRMRGVFTNVQCAFCGLQEENQEHLLWLCLYVKKIWVKVFDWRGISSKFNLIADGCYWNWLSFYQNSKVKIGWSISITATLWSVWLYRNLMVFEGKRYKEEEVVWLIKQRSLLWWSAGITGNRICWNLWNLNPTGALLSRLYLSEGDNEAEYEFYSYTDGAFKMNNNGEILTGMGGFVKDSQGKLSFIFFGPSKVFDSFHAELEAIEYLLRAVEGSDKKMAKIRVHLDSEEVLKLLLRIRAGLIQILDIVDFKEIFNLGF